MASDPNLQVLGAAYIQHRCYSDAAAKKQVTDPPDCPYYLLMNAPLALDALNDNSYQPPTLPDLWSMAVLADHWAVWENLLSISSAENGQSCPVCIYLHHLYTPTYIYLWHIYTHHRRILKITSIYAQSCIHL